MFSLQLKFSENYPSVPPLVRFTTPIFHPNGSVFERTSSAVFVDGLICLDIIKEKWSPINTVSIVLTSIQVCFSVAYEH